MDKFISILQSSVSGARQHAIREMKIHVVILCGARLFFPGARNSFQISPGAAREDTRRRHVTNLYLELCIDGNRP